MDVSSLMYPLLSVQFVLCGFRTTFVLVLQSLFVWTPTLCLYVTIQADKSSHTCSAYLSALRSSSLCFWQTLRLPLLSPSLLCCARTCLAVSSRCLFQKKMKKLWSAAETCEMEQTGLEELTGMLFAGPCSALIISKPNYNLVYGDKKIYFFRSYMSRVNVRWGFLPSAEDSCHRQTSHSYFECLFRRHEISVVRYS